MSQFVYFSLVLREPEETKTKYSAPYRFQVFHTYDYTSQMVNNWTILEICMSTIHFQLQQCEILLVRLHLMRILPILAWHIQVCNVLVYTVTDYYLGWADYEQLLIFFWKHYSVRTEKLHNTLFIKKNVFFTFSGSKFFFENTEKLHNTLFIRLF